MLRSDFHFDLPTELIAQEPPAGRGDSRLLVVANDAFHDVGFNDITRYLNAGDLLVFNDTRVIPARLHGQKSSGGRVEVLIERILDEKRALAHVRASRAPKPGSSLLLENVVQVRVISRQNDLFELYFEGTRPLLDLLQQYGHIPLPPYIDRTDNPSDSERYQTVYARQPGAIAAPTAGLHFTPAVLDSLRANGIGMATVELAVGLDTFRPVMVDRLDDHVMHTEWYRVPDETVAAVEAADRVVAIGTTAVRALESWKGTGEQSGRSDLFIRRPYEWQAVDVLLTNFHLPQSTLLCLVDGFVGPRWRELYETAVAEEYRFLSFGDAMLLTR